MIALVDYGMGNLRSVEKALLHVGGKVRIIRDAAGLDGVDRVVVPGVGAFGDCMDHLRKQNFLKPLREFVDGGGIFLGICLGYQLLFDGSEENPDREGLGVFRGQVERFPRNQLKVPQIGWNQLEIQKPGCPLLKGVKAGSHVYFVHSYFPVPQDPEIVCTRTEYGVTYASMVWKGNVFACQFHPEKSQSVGLQILKNFVEYPGDRPER